MLKEIEENKESTIVIIRFMGTTKMSSNIESVFKSIESQLEAIFEIDLNEKEYSAAHDFKSRLSYISNKHLKNDKQLIILLDSIDQLAENNYNLRWFFTKLPNNVKLIYSVLSDYPEKSDQSILNKLKTEIRDKNIHVLNLISSDNAKIILRNYLKSANRILEEKQEASIHKMIDTFKDLNPLQIKLIFDIVSKWKSSDVVPDDLIKCRSNIDIIKYLFENIEKHVFDNEILFKHCLFYLTLFEYRGITENELEDILSIDDMVLDSIFVYHHPPVRRFQIGLFNRLKYELKDYITNKVTDDESVIAW